MNAYRTRRPHKRTASLSAAGTAKAIDSEDRQSLIVERGMTELDASSVQYSLAQSDALLECETACRAIVSGPNEILVSSNVPYMCLISDIKRDIIQPIESVTRLGPSHAGS